MVENKKFSANLFAAILFLVAALGNFISLIRLFSGIRWAVRYHYLPTYIISIIFSVATIAGLVITSVALIKKQRDLMPLIGLGILAAVHFLKLIFSIFPLHFYKLPATLSMIIALIGYAGAVFVAVEALTDYIPQYKDIAKRFWFLPAACIAGSFIFQILSAIFGYRITFGGFLLLMLIAAGVLLANLWMLYPEKELKVPQGSSGAASGASFSASSLPSEEEGFINIAMHVLLLLFTCGIWMYIWIYKTTKYLNRAEGEEYRDPVTKLLLCIFVPFYSIYWIYKSALRIDKMANAKGIQSDISTLCLILAIFVGIVPPILMQDKINAIATASGSAQPIHQASAQPTVNNGAPEELKKYKELLDDGIITQEEFDAKKKQLLGL